MSTEMMRFTTLITTPLGIGRLMTISIKCTAEIRESKRKKISY